MIHLSIDGRIILTNSCCQVMLNCKWVCVCVDVNQVQQCDNPFHSNSVHNICDDQFFLSRYDSWICEYFTLNTVFACISIELCVWVETGPFRFELGYCVVDSSSKVINSLEITDFAIETLILTVFFQFFLLLLLNIIFTFIL